MSGWYGIAGSVPGELTEGSRRAHGETGKGGEVVRGLAVWLAIILIAGTAWAGQAFIVADAGISAWVGWQKAAESMTGFSGGLAYRPTYVDAVGIEREGRLLFVSTVSQGSGSYGQIGGLYRYWDAWGVDWFAGPYVLAVDQGKNYALGPVIEVRWEFDTGKNPMFFSTGVGYVWRTPTEDNPEPNNVPFYVKIGARTQ